MTAIGVMMRQLMSGSRLEQLHGIEQQLGVLVITMIMTEPKGSLGLHLIILFFVILTNPTTTQLHTVHKTLRSCQWRVRGLGLFLLIAAHQCGFVEGFPAGSPIGLIASTDDTAANRSSTAPPVYFAEVGPFRPAEMFAIVVVAIAVCASAVFAIWRLCCRQRRRLQDGERDESSHIAPHGGGQGHHHQQSGASHQTLAIDCSVDDIKMVPVGTSRRQPEEPSSINGPGVSPTQTATPSGDSLSPDQPSAVCPGTATNNIPSNTSNCNLVDPVPTHDDLYFSSMGGLFQTVIPTVIPDETVLDGADNNSNQGAGDLADQTVMELDEYISSITPMSNSLTVVGQCTELSVSGNRLEDLMASILDIVDRHRDVTTGSYLDSSPASVASLGGSTTVVNSTHPSISRGSNTSVAVPVHGSPSISDRATATFESEPDLDQTRFSDFARPDLGRAAWPIYQSPNIMADVPAQSSKSDGMESEGGGRSDLQSAKTI